jgi:hypothetical protein
VLTQDDDTYDLNLGESWSIKFDHQRRKAYNRGIIDALDVDGLWLSDRLEFKSKKIRVSLNAPIKAEQKAESVDVMKTVDEDRRLLIQAVIVR